MLCGARSGFGATARSISSSSSFGTWLFDALGAADPLRFGRRVGQHLVEDRAHRVDVGAIVRRPGRAPLRASRSRAAVARRLGRNRVRRQLERRNLGVALAPSPTPTRDSGRRAQTPPHARPPRRRRSGSPVSTARRRFIGCPAISARSDWPCRNSNARKTRPSCSPASKSVMTFGCDSEVIDSAWVDQLRSCRGVGRELSGQQPQRDRASPLRVARAEQIAGA